jgi:2'-hydroxyisoflavone reductase
VLLEDGGTGTYDAVGPAEPVTLAGLVAACAEAAGASVELVELDPSAVEPPLPLVLPDAGHDVLFRRSAARARAAGLPATPLVRTAAAVLAWDRGRGEPPLTAGISEEQETRLLG